MRAPNPYALAAHMPASLWAEWRAYFGDEPHGEERQDWHAALVASEVRNSVAALVGGESLGLDKFLLSWQHGEDPLTTNGEPCESEDRAKLGAWLKRELAK